ncbi:thioredoxin domain-containing protein [Vulcanibacillus modesticaldus]|uniref:thioredoxin domain-containing protein n=1 Tax=Vulcanibacillus modesticaldus TaxID=337097 RepID=UPI001C4083A8|nr:thioredoxin domain-containing protein [Vulcanibacillus modesticaldus]
MAKIDEKDRETIRNMFAEQMQGTAHIRFFSSKEGCDYCEDTKEILEELAELSDKIDLQLFDKDENPDEVNRYGVDKYPAIVFVKEDGTDTGVRFYGIPSGYEFSTLIEDIIDIANDKTALSPATIEQLKQITQDVNISVFVTPT